MEITLKNLKVSALVPDDSLWFRAVACVNGVEAFTAGDDGMGGPPRYEPVDERGRRPLRETGAYAVSLPPKQSPDGTAVLAAMTARARDLRRRRPSAGR